VLELKIKITKSMHLKSGPKSVSR